MPKISPGERFALKAQGFIPENVQACRDFNEGLITLAEMWRILNKNINIKGASDRERLTTRPKKGDWVTVNDGEREGYIAFCVHAYGQVDQVGVQFTKGDKSFDMLDGGLFVGTYSSLRGRTHWFVED